MQDVNFVVTKEMVDEMFEDEMAEHYSK
uniref:Uncharacterized protein n=1 Tax=Panagrolaimus sp. JU765 TaxID=591449 RepID=A0AC34PXF3_9BILA